MDDLNSREALLATMQDLQADLDLVIAEVGEERMEQPGSFDEWTFKDLIAHLTSWRLITAARLEAGLRHEEPVFPWPAQFNEDEHIDEINRWFFETNRDKPVAQILRESNETFERVEQAIAAMPEDDLLTPGRFGWLHDTGVALGPAVVRGTRDHFHEDHEPDIRAWLARQ